MIGMNEINVLIDNVDTQLKACRSDADSIRKRWNKVQSSEAMKTEYAKTYAKCVDDFYSICSVLNTVCNIPIDCRTLESFIDESSFHPKLKESFKDRIGKIKKNADELKSGISFLKTGLSARVKFYDAIRSK